MKKSIKLLVLVVAIALSLIACKGGEEITTEKVAPTLIGDGVSVTIDIYDKLYKSVVLSEYVNNNDYATLTYELTSTNESITLSNVSENNTVVIYSTGIIGNYTVNVNVISDQNTVLQFAISVSVVDTSPNPELTTEISDISEDVPVFIDGSTRIEYILDLDDYFTAYDSTEFTVTSNVETDTYVLDSHELTLTFLSTGTRNITVSALKNDTVTASSTCEVDLMAITPDQLVNGDFENGWTGWDVDEWATAAYSIYDSEFDIWGNNVGSDGHYLYGYYNESGTAEFSSSLFTVAGTGMITFKMAGNSTDDLQLKLMKYNADGEDELIATFNNWYYGKYGMSGFIFRDYFYQIDMETYDGSTCYFVISDNKTEDFGFICLDNIITHYTINPDTTLMYAAGFEEDPTGTELDFSDTANDPFTELAEVTYQLPNGEFENGYDNWFMSATAKQAYAIFNSPVDIWSNPVNATRQYLYGYYDESAMVEFHSNLFQVSGSGVITFKMAGNSTADLQFKLMKYNPDGEDEVIETFNNWYFPISAESGFIFRNYFYEVDMETYNGSYCYFIVSDSRAADFGFICLDDIVTYYENVPTLTGTWYRAGYINQPENWDVLPGETPEELIYQLPNGDFEDEWNGWTATETDKTAYSIINSATDIWSNPVNNNGYYLYGFTNESAIATFNSAQFVLGGSGVVTFKMAGNSTADLQFKLMKYNPDGEDEVIETFNNWYFPISAESGFIFRNYFYEVDMETYDGSTCYFEVIDNKTSDFGFICLDDIVTYYENVPTLTGTWYRAGYINQPENWNVLPS